MFVQPGFDAEPFRVMDPRFSVSFTVFVPFSHVPIIGIAVFMVMAVGSRSVTWRGRTSVDVSWNVGRRSCCVSRWRQGRRSDRLRGCGTTVIARVGRSCHTFRQLCRPPCLVSAWTCSWQDSNQYYNSFLFFATTTNGARLPDTNHWLAAGPVIRLTIMT